MADLTYTRDLLGNMHVRVGDTVLPVVFNGEPKPLGSDRGAIRSIHFDGVVGTIERASEVPGRSDIEHFLGDERLKPFRDAFAAAQAVAEARREEVRRANEAAQAEALKLAKAQQEAQVARADEAAAKIVRDQGENPAA